MHIRPSLLLSASFILSLSLFCSPLKATHQNDEEEKKQLTQHLRSDFTDLPSLIADNDSIGKSIQSTNSQQEGKTMPSPEIIDIDPLANTLRPDDKSIDSFNKHLLKLKLYEEDLHSLEQKMQCSSHTHERQLLALEIHNSRKALLEYCIQTSKFLDKLELEDFSSNNFKQNSNAFYRSLKRLILESHRVLEQEATAEDYQLLGQAYDSLSSVRAARLIERKPEYHAATVKMYSKMLKTLKRNPSAAHIMLTADANKKAAKSFKDPEVVTKYYRNAGDYYLKVVDLLGTRDNASNYQNAGYCFVQVGLNLKDQSPQEAVEYFMKALHSYNELVHIIDAQTIYLNYEDDIKSLKIAAEFLREQGQNEVADQYLSLIPRMQAKNDPLSVSLDTLYEELMSAYEQLSLDTNS